MDYGGRFKHAEVEREQWALESDKSLLAEIESQAPMEADFDIKTNRITTIHLMVSNIRNFI